MQSLDKNLPAIFQALVDKAIAGDRESAIYLIDRKLGKPTMQMDVKGSEELGAGAILRVLQVLAEARAREITGGELPGARVYEIGTTDVISNADTIEAEVIDEST